MLERNLLGVLHKRILEKRRFIQTVSGPRQIGKTTLVLQLAKKLACLVRYETADTEINPSAAWLDRVWETARTQMRLGRHKEAVLIVDEVQKIPAWSEAVKKNWDADSRGGINLKIILLGSSRLLLQRGLNESLAGRFETHFLGHWTLAETRQAFGFTAEQFIWFGGYPAANGFAGDESRFKEYVRNAIIEPAVSKDILMLESIAKPALLRQLCELGMAYNTQILSYNKMLGQLHNAGNTETLARYLTLLGEAKLIQGIEAYSGKKVRSKASSPKFVNYTTALMTARETRVFDEARADPAFWGRVVEGAVGAHLLLHASSDSRIKVCYFRDGDREVDFIVTFGAKLLGIEVKSGGSGKTTDGLAVFKEKFPSAQTLLVGASGLPVEDFLTADVKDVFRT
jgi:predicted AAA+ superfamily ATPase